MERETEQQQVTEGTSRYKFMCAGAKKENENLFNTYAYREQFDSTEHKSRLIDLSFLR
jgi:hypothetical protein